MSSSALVRSVLEPLLVGTVYESEGQATPDDRPGPAANLLWCAPTRDLLSRHPHAIAALDVDHPDGCSDLMVDVDAEGRLEDAAMECLDLGEGLVGLPIGDALPELARRIADVLR